MGGWVADGAIETAYMYTHYVILYICTLYWYMHTHRAFFSILDRQVHAHVRSH